MARILVIDDQEHIRSIIKQLLLLDNYEVDLAENGMVGMKMADQNVYDLVITDIIMPEKDGLEVVRELKRLCPVVKIVAVSGGATKLDFEMLLKTARAFGADRILPKPIDFMMLQSIVKELLATVSG